MCSSHSLPSPAPPRADITASTPRPRALTTLVPPRKPRETPPQPSTWPADTKARLTRPREAAPSAQWRAMANTRTALHKDPAIIKWNNMVVNRHKYFRWTKRTAFLTTMYVVVVPATLGYFGYITDGKWNLRGKRRGDTISEF
ncbi:hypothetical protein C7974DRAFT_420080 [Boeremia exigua]|uniref:uncharacterized protein n=1 Tax=Boeremia exigua TaxID=749465 RepID=UPI001E8DBE84|nr:uncharacterized protein C7974DRAFT_420080 [Boeremia exigua]KAH6644618.1 hypothetical protein C7974DRAFT_420080 [Boeremia exigua]